ncbi:MAG: MFS transporter [Clostridiales bacterium]|nr:MFS transporter [Clostridiales bacterium]
MQTIRRSYNHTLYASYLGYITQAIVNTFVPLLFLTFQSTYQISLERITSLVTVNFGIQLVVDLLSTKWVDKIGYRISIVAAHICAAGGLAGLGIFPDLFPDPYWGLLFAVGLYAVGGGLIEVLVSPIVEACPTEKKSAAMSLLHSFYCWGCVLVILISTLFFSIFGIANWRVLSLVWAALPLLNAFYYSQVPIATLHEEGEAMPARKLFSSGVFWVFALLMVCAGASEQAMSQWASAFAESGLQISKSVGDLAGPCMFSILMGVTRVFYAKFSERINLTAFMIGSGILCIVSYLLTSLSVYPLLSLVGCGLCGLSVGILWPGAFSLACTACPKGGTAMFALLALAGDLGCSAGPSLVGFVSDAAQGNLKAGLLAAIGFPILLLLGLLACKKVVRKK